MAWQLGSGACLQECTAGGACLEKKASPPPPKKTQSYLHYLHVAGWPVPVRAGAPRPFQRLQTTRLSGSFWCCGLCWTEHGDACREELLLQDGLYVWQLVTVVEFGAKIFGYCSKATFKAMKRARDVWRKWKENRTFSQKNTKVQGLAIV